MTTQAKAPAPVATRSTRRFTVAEYYRMAEVGILQPDERVELIKGEIIVMPPIGDRHAMEVRQATRVFYRIAGGTVIISVQNPIHLGEHFQPQPDVALLRFREDNYPAHPTPADILLVIEVSDTSLNYDRNVKVPLYAGAGIVETWLVNLEADYIEVYRQPGPEGYQQSVIFRRGEKISPVSRPDLELNVDDLLPPPVAKTQQPQPTAGGPEESDSPAGNA